MEEKSKITEKACKSCGEDKELDKFHRDSRRKDGRHDHCITCRRKQAREYAKEKYKPSGQKGRPRKDDE